MNTDSTADWHGRTRIEGQKQRQGKHRDLSTALRTIKLCAASVEMTCYFLLPEIKPDHSFTLRSLRALVMTETELKLMAAAATMGLSSHPKNG